MNPTILILVGITGDLSRRKLLPAIEELKEKGLLPEHFELVGVTRRANDDGYFHMDLDTAGDYHRLADYLKTIEERWGASAQRLFYLSVAPTVAPSIIHHLGMAGLARVPHTRLLLEKPFALDSIPVFSEEQIYRIDHYLAKTSVRALPKIDVQNVETITVTAVEAIGIEGRGHFYEQTGALKDFVQSHLLEVAAQALSPHARISALQGLSVDLVEERVHRGQYIGYREAVQNPESVVETFVSVQLQSDTARYKGSIVLTTGKALSRKHTDLSVVYKDGAVQVFSLHDTDNAYEKVFLEAMQGNKEFFVSKEEVAETIRIVRPIEEAWSKSADDLFFYEQGTNPK
jgi:glucose-6-phosphate 1-dehydrogenase